MFKKYMFFTFIFLCSFANSAFAHTHIESSSPQIDEIITEPLKQISLTFEGKVEQNSTFTLQNSRGEAIPVAEISVSESVLSGSLSAPLENGEYRINWSIIGADGHVMEGDIPFTVDVPAVETNNAEVTDSELNLDTEEPGAASKAEALDNESTEDTSSSYLVPSLIGVLILIVVGSFLFIAKRKE